jgi:hypothetical protein
VALELDQQREVSMVDLITEKEYIPRRGDGGGKKGGGGTVT